MSGAMEFIGGHRFTDSAEPNPVRIPPEKFHEHNILGLDEPTYNMVSGSLYVVTIALVFYFTVVKALREVAKEAGGLKRD